MLFNASLSSRKVGCVPRRNTSLLGERGAKCWDDAQIFFPWRIRRQQPKKKLVAVGQRSTSALHLPFHGEDALSHLCGFPLDSAIKQPKHKSSGSSILLPSSARDVFSSCCLKMNSIYYRVSHPFWHFGAKMVEGTGIYSWLVYHQQSSSLHIFVNNKPKIIVGSMWRSRQRHLEGNNEEFLWFVVHQHQALENRPIWSHFCWCDVSSRDRVGCQSCTSKLPHSFSLSHFNFHKITHTLETGAYYCLAGT